jgi:phospholipid/cholesterol/gamma-HCH transport system ATP-binding protein
MNDASGAESIIQVRDFTAAYGDKVIVKDLNFDVQPGEVFIILGGSGCGKSTVLKHMIGLFEPFRGDILLQGQSIVTSVGDQRLEILKTIGVMYQSGALFGNMTLLENVRLPMEEFTDLPPDAMDLVVGMKLDLVGLGDSLHLLPSEISGGMQKRAGLARAMALDPDILFFDEPSAGLDPLSSRRLDELILELRDSLGTTFVVVTHELPSIFTIADDSVFLDAEARTMTAAGDPKWLRDHSDVPKVRSFLNRGEGDEQQPTAEGSHP